MANWRGGLISELRAPGTGQGALGWLRTLLEPGDSSDGAPRDLSPQG